MNLNAYPASIRELMAKNIILSRKGIIRFNNQKICLQPTLREKDTKEIILSGIQYLPNGGGVFLAFYDERMMPIEKLQERYPIYEDIIANHEYPDGEEFINEKTLRDRLTLRKDNIYFIDRHNDLTETDFTMIETHRTCVEYAHDQIREHPIPLPGDIVEGSLKNGTTFSQGAIISDLLVISKQPAADGHHVCLTPYSAPMILALKETPGYAIGCAGGPFRYIRNESLELIGETTRLMEDWGHCGPAAGGMLKFSINVNRWRLKD